jgi:hypothetical protein
MEDDDDDNDGGGDGGGGGGVGVSSGFGLGYILEIDPIHRQEAEGLKTGGGNVIGADDLNAVT